MLVTAGWARSRAQEIDGDRLQLGYSSQPLGPRRMHRHESQASQGQLG